MLKRRIPRWLRAKLRLSTGYSWRILLSEAATILFAKIMAIRPILIQVFADSVETEADAIFQICDWAETELTYNTNP